MDQERLLDVLLDNASAVSSLSTTVLRIAAILNQVSLYLVKVIEDAYAVATVGRFARLKDPQLAFFASCFEGLKLRMQLKIRLRRH